MRTTHQSYFFLHSFLPYLIPSDFIPSYSLQPNDAISSHFKSRWKAFAKVCILFLLLHSYLDNVERSHGLY